MTGTSPRVDFYQMSGRFHDPVDVACVLVGKAWPDIDDIAVVGDPATLQTLDTRLWEKPAGRFLPHGIGDDRAPIRLVPGAPAGAALLINLDAAAELPAGDYRRVCEIVPPDERARKRLRARWLEWKSRGAELHHHVLK
ncbi:MAG: DNA polymerase III subunit chi [Wenzhouxiangellaceae bacterium]|nr:DNA polymerase III subunit chi [Wenzhouxiangellaceae bacterium]